MNATDRPPTWKILLAFGIIYFVWGSTFLAIRVGVREVPPFLYAALRFLAAGVILLVWVRLRGEKLPTAPEWRAASVVAILIFVFDYGLLFWAERRVPSGLAAVMMATIPVFMTLSEVLYLKTRQITARLVFALLAGVAGVAVLVSGSLSFGEVPIDMAGAIALLLAALSWSVASVLMRKLRLPASKAMSSATQMLTGGVFLLLASGLLGEFGGFHIAVVSREAWWALAYLIAGGSIVAFTAYVWLLHHESPAKVSTYAYVNPVVAVALGYFFGGEAVGVRTLAGSLLILISVVVLTTTASRAKA